MLRDSQASRAEVKLSDRVLLIEDDHELGSQIVEHLRRVGLSAAWWLEGRSIDGRLPSAIELVILDLMLPGVHGLDVLQQLRAGSEIPVLVLSARNDTADKVRALQLGADDYMTKPFWPEELIERVRARLRRPAMQRGDVIEVGSLKVDLAHHQVTFGDKRIELTPVEFNFLLELARRPGAAITRKWLVERVLVAERDGGERTLDVHVSRLRKKLGDPTVIQTVWGIGYRLLDGGV